MVAHQTHVINKYVCRDVSSLFRSTMLDYVHIIDLTHQEHPPSRRLRVCRFHETKRELSFQWGSEEEIMIDEMNPAMTRIHIDDQHHVTYDTDDDYPNITALVFGIRAFGKCYAYQHESSHVSRGFPKSLRQWWWCEVQQAFGIQNGEYIRLDALDQTFEQWESGRRGRSIMRNENELEPEYDQIQFIYKTIGFTAMNHFTTPVPSVSLTTTTTTMTTMPTTPQRPRTSYQRLNSPQHSQLQVNLFNNNNHSRRASRERQTLDADENHEETHLRRDLSSMLMSITPAGTDDILELLRDELLRETGFSPLTTTGRTNTDLNDSTTLFFTSTPMTSTPPPPLLPPPSPPPPPPLLSSPNTRPVYDSNDVIR